MLTCGKVEAERMVLIGCKKDRILEKTCGFTGWYYVMPIVPRIQSGILHSSRAPDKIVPQHFSLALNVPRMYWVFFSTNNLVFIFTQKLQTSCIKLKPWHSCAMNSGNDWSSACLPGEIFILGGNVVKMLSYVKHVWVMERDVWVYQLLKMWNIYYILALTNQASSKSFSAQFSELSRMWRCYALAENKMTKFWRDKTSSCNSLNE